MRKELSFDAREYQSQQEQKYFVEFKGNAKEYFGIWIVNIFLTIVTLGIYSAWAKVRTQRYFYGNTFIDGHSFEYHATPKQILIGRLIVLVGFIIYAVLTNVNAILAVVLPITLYFILPFLIVSSLRFNARVSSYRNIHFNFDGSKGRAFVVYFLYPILAAFTLFTTYPLAERAQKEFYVENHLFGGKRFFLSASTREYYRAFLLTFGILLVVLIFLFGLSALSYFGSELHALSQNLEGQNLENQNINGIIGLFVLYIVFFLFFIAIPMAYRAMLRNLIYNNTLLDGKHRFISTVSVKRYLWIAITNAIVTILTLGLMRPWAAIRMAHYVASATQVIMVGNLASYTTELEKEGSALGSEYTDIDGIDVGAGL